MVVNLRRDCCTFKKKVPPVILIETSDSTVLGTKTYRHVLSLFL